MAPIIARDLTPVDLSDMTPDEIITAIPPLPQLRLVSQGSSGRAYYEPAIPGLLRQSFSKGSSEPWELFIERAECYWRRGCALVLVQRLKLTREDERALLRACWLRLVRPSALPGWPDFNEPAVVRHAVDPSL